MLKRMFQRRGTASEWSTANPILGDGEIGWIKGTQTFKIGNGVDHWNDLDTFDGGGAPPSSQITRLDMFRSGTLIVANGVAQVYANHSGTLSLVRYAVGIVSAGSDITARVRQNGSIIDTQSIAVGTHTVKDTGLTIPVAVDDYFTLDITQIGSTDAGGWLTATLEIVS